MPVDELVFVGFNSRILALSRGSGEIAWSWQAAKPRSGGFVTMLLDGDRLVVSVSGYMYCLDPATGEQLWYNETKGFGTGVASLVSVRGQSPHALATVIAAAVEEQQRQAAAAAAAAGS